MKKINGPQGFEVHPRSLNDIRKIAKRVKNVFGFNRAYVDVIKVLDFLLEAGIIELEIIPDVEFHKGEYANTRLVSINDENIPLISLRESVYNSADSGNTRHRFTIAHEIGHAILHTPSLRLARSIRHHEKKEYYRDSEWQADNFAAELLIDIEFIHKTDIADDLMERFAISHQAAEVRLKKIKKSQLNG